MLNAILRVLSRQIDIGNNAMEVLDAAWPNISKSLEQRVRTALGRVRDTYFEPQQVYIDRVRKGLFDLEKGLLELKYKE